MWRIGLFFNRVSFMTTIPKYIKILLLVLIVATISSATMAFNFYAKLKNLENPAAASEAETKRVVAELLFGRQMRLLRSLLFLSQKN